VTNTKNDNDLQENEEQKMELGEQKTYTFESLDFEALDKRKRLVEPKKTQKIFFTMLASSAVFIILILLTFVLILLINGSRGISFKLIFMKPGPEVDYGIRPAIIGTILLILGAVGLALPLGLAAAIYLNEYAKEGIIVNIINQGINNLAGVPSIVFGIFGYAFFVLALGIGKSLVAAWLTLACMILPTIIRTSQEALKTVPRDYREGSLALGATKWQTIRHVVLPAATPGISTGVILSLGRAAGETAAILFVGVATGIPAFTGFLSRFPAIPFELYSMAVSAPSSTRNIQWAIALILVVVVFGFNLSAILIRNRAEKQRI